jgi:hypothetical protein
MMDAWHLPGLDADALSGTHAIGPGLLQVRCAQLRAGALAGLAARLIEVRQRHLADRPLDDIVRIIDAAALRLHDREDPIRRTADALLPAFAGYSEAMHHHVLDRMIDDWRAPALRKLLQAEVDGGRMLDHFVERDGRRIMAIGPRLTTHVFAGNVPGVSVTSLVRALLLRSASIGKTAAREPVLAVLFAQAIASIDAGMGECMAVTYWRGGDDAPLQEALLHADIAVVYGGDSAVAEVRMSAPQHVRVLEHGPKISFAIIARESLAEHGATERLAREAALATATFDQHGCVSPHVVYVESGASVSARDVAAAIARELARLDNALPRGVADADESVRMHDARARAEFRGIAGHDVELFDAGTASVIFDADPAFETSCLNRVLYVKEIGDAMHLAALLAPFAGLLQTVALECGIERREEIARMLATAGATRITTLHDMPWPAPDWLHDGRRPLLELVRLAELER